MRPRPDALVFLIHCARITLEAERLTGLRMPYVVHFDLLQILDCARKEARRGT